MVTPVTDRARPDHSGPEHKDVPTSGASSAATLEPTAPERVLALQRTAGNRAVGQMLARETATKKPAGLERLDELLDKFDVDENAVIAHLATLSDPEKAIVLRDYKARIADPLNPNEMARAVKSLNTTLWNKLVWVGAAGEPDYGDIRELITSTKEQKEKTAIGTKEWRSWFIAVCSNATMKQAVVDLGFRLPTQLWWMAGEMSADYSDIRSLCQATTVTDDDRKALKTTDWRDWFVGVCGDATMRDAVVDLKFDAVTKVEWLLAEDTNAGLLRSALLADGKATDVGRVVIDPKLVERIRAGTGAEGVRVVDQVLVELAKAEKPEEFPASSTSSPRRGSTTSGPPQLAQERLDRLGDERFAALAARIMLVARHAPGARREALRLLTAQLQDRETALRMITKPLQVVIVPRGKKMTELDEFKSLLEADDRRRQGQHLRRPAVGARARRRHRRGRRQDLRGDHGGEPARRRPRRRAPAAPGLHHRLLDHHPRVRPRAAHQRAERGPEEADLQALRRQARGDGHEGHDHAAQRLARRAAREPDRAGRLVGGRTGRTTSGWRRSSRTRTRTACYENYSSQNDMEYFAQLSNAYLGTNLGTDPTTGQARNNGRAWIAANEDKEMLDLLDKLYKNKTVNDIDAAGKLTPAGCAPTRTRPAPAAARAAPAGRAAARWSPGHDRPRGARVRRLRRGPARAGRQRRARDAALDGRTAGGRRRPAPAARAAPGPGEPMTTERPPGGHPFLDAQAYDPVSEDRLRRLLSSPRASTTTSSG